MTFVYYLYPDEPAISLGPNLIESIYKFYKNRQLYERVPLNRAFSILFEDQPSTT